MPRTTFSCRSLPAEIWGQICSYMDDLTLWMVLRHVSKIVRSEAEHEFATTRLPRLELNWTRSGTFLHHDHFFKLEFHCSPISSPEFIGLNDVGSRARFHVLMYCKVQGVKGDYVADQEKFHQITHQLVSQALQDVDVEINDDEKHTNLTATLGFFSNNNPLPALQFHPDAQECSFDWKAFLNTFYADYMYVEKMKQPKNPFASVATRNEVTEQYFIRQWKLPVVWHKTHGKLEDPLFEHAYLARLKRAHVKAGLQFSLSKKSFEEIKEEVVRLRWKRNRDLFSYLMGTPNIREERERMERYVVDCSLRGIYIVA